MAVLNPERNREIIDRQRFSSVPDAKNLTPEQVVYVLRRGSLGPGSNPVIGAVRFINEFLRHPHFPGLPYPPHSIVESAFIAIDQPDSTMADYRKL